MAQYALFLYDDPKTFSGLSPERMQQVIQKYVAWGNRLRAGGQLTDGQKLADEPGRVMRGGNGQVRVTDGPYSETKEVLAGYYILTAGSYDEALELARDCPHLEYGGAIELRQIDTMGQ